LRRLPSPLDRFDPARIPAAERALAGGGDPEKAPIGLAAVLTECRPGPSPAGGLALDAKDTYLVVAAGARLGVWNLQTGSFLGFCEGPAAGIDCVALSANRQRLAAGGRDGKVYLWALEATAAPGLPAGNPFRKDRVGPLVCDGPVRALALRADGRRLASAGATGVVTLWDLETGKQLTTCTGPAAPCNGLAFSPDGKYLAAAWPDRTSRLWDAATGRQLFAGTQPAGVVRVAFHPHERLLVAHGSDNGVHLWAVPDGTHVADFPASPGGMDVAFGPDGQTLAVAARDGGLALWDLAPRERTRVWALGQHIRGLALAADGRHLLTLGPDGTVYLFRLGPSAEVRPWQPPADSPLDALRHDLVPDDELRRAGGGDPAQAPAELVGVLGGSRLRHRGYVYRVAWSPDGKRLAAGGYHEPAKVWDAATGRELFAVAVPSSPGAVAFSPDGKRLAVGLETGKVLIRDAETGQEVHPTFAAHGGFIRDVAFSPDGRWLATAGQDNLVKVWETAGWREVCACKGQVGIFSTVAFSPDSKLLAAPGPDGTVRVWDAAAGREVFALRDGAKDFAGVAFAPDGTRLVAAGGDNKLHTWDPQTGKVLPAGPQCVQTFAFRPDGKGLAVVRVSSGPVALLDAAGAKEDRTLATTNVSSLAYRPDGERLAVADTLGGIRLWDVRTGQEVSLSAAHRGPMIGVTVSPDGARVISRGDDQAIRGWDARTGRPAFTVPARAHVGNSLTVSPDGKVLFCDSDISLGIKARDPATGRDLWSLPPGANDLLRLVAGPDGTRLAAVRMHEKAVRLWDVATGRQLAVLTGTADLTDAAFAPDGRRLATVDGAGQLTAWDVAGERQLWTASAGGRGRYAVAWQPDGRRVAVGGPAGVVRLFDAESGKDTGQWSTSGEVSAINGIAFHPGGEALAVGHAGGRLVVYETASPGKREWLLPPAVECLAFAPDGRHVLAGNSNGTGYVLRLGPSEAPRRH
jgi:WD40 repeat protein